MDFNALKILNSVIDSGSVTKSAKRLAVSPSAITYALNKLRDVTSNNLVVRRNGKMEPTQIAMELNKAYLKINDILRDSLISVSSPPEMSRKSLRVNTHSFFELMLLDMIADNDIFENIRIEFVGDMKKTEDREELIRCKIVEIDIGSKLHNDFSIVSERIIKSGYKVMINKNHPSITDSLTIEDWYENKKIRWVNGYINPMVDVGGAGLIKGVFCEDDISVVSGSSLSGIITCVNTNDLMIVPEFIEGYLSKILPIKFFPLPFDSTITSSLYLNYHKTMKTDKHFNAFLAAIRSMSATHN